MSHNPFEQVAAETKTIQSSVRSGGVPASALHKGVIRAAYLIENNWSSANIDLAIHVELPSGYEHKIQKTVLINRSPMSLNKKTTRQELLFSYVAMSHIVGAAVEGKTLADLYPSVQVKPIKLYDFNTKQDVLTDVKMVNDLVGKELYIGLQRKISNKRATVGGEWVDLPERKETLEFGVAGSITDRRSFTEFNNNIAPEDATDLDKWEKLNAGKDWDAYKDVAANIGVPAGVAAGAAAVGAIDFGTS